VPHANGGLGSGRADQLSMLKLSVGNDGFVNRRLPFSELGRVAGERESP